MHSGTAPDGITIESMGGEPWVVHRQGYKYLLQPSFHDVKTRLAAMNAQNIDIAVLSIAPPLFLYSVGKPDAVAAARATNDAIAEMVAAAPDRFVGLATLPMQDPAASVLELKRATSALGLKGAQIGSHIEGIPLDDLSVRPVLETASALRVPLLVHPYYVGSAGGLDDFYLTNLQGNPWQTAVCASRLILSGTLDALPNLDLILVHGGGHLPYQIGRLDHGYRVRPEASAPDHLPSSYLRRFHYDTLTHNVQATRWLIDQVGSDRVLLGTDMPFDMAGPSLEGQLDRSQKTDSDWAAIAHGNAERIFALPTSQRK